MMMCERVSCVFGSYCDNDDDDDDDETVFVLSSPHNSSFGFSRVLLAPLWSRATCVGACCFVIFVVCLFVCL